MRWLFFIVLSLALFMTFLPSSASAAACSDTWTGPAEGTWQTASNWSAGHVPTEADVACIGSGSTTRVTSGTNKVGVVQGEGGIYLSSTLELTNSSEVSEIGSFTLSGGTLKGSGTLNVSSSMTVTGEPRLQGTGSTVIMPGATATAQPNNYMRIEGRRLVNRGTFTVNPPELGEVLVNEGAEILNEGTFNVNSEKLVALGQYGAGGTFVNTGTFRKNAGTGTSTVEMKFENKGTVEIQTGKLSFKGGGSANASARWEANEGAELQFAASAYSLNGGSVTGVVVIAGPVTTEGVTATSAQFKLGSGPLIVQGEATIVKTLTLSGGTLKGSGTLNVSSSMTVTGEPRLQGTGSTVIMPGATATAQPNNYMRIEGRRLVNRGTFTVNPPELGEVLVNEGAEILNEGTFNVNSEKLVALGQYGAGGTFVNTGTFRKNAGTGTSTVEMKFENKGTVEIQTGKLSVGGGATSPSSRWESAEGSETIFSHGSSGFALEGKMSGDVSVAGGSVTAEGVTGTMPHLTITSGGAWGGSLTDISNSVTVNSVALKASGTLAIEGKPETIGSFTLSGGTLKGSGTLNVSSSMTVTGEPRLQGTGSTVIMPGATATAQPNNYMRIEGRRLVNRGTFTVNPPELGEVLVNEGAEILNEGTFNVNSEKLVALGQYGAGGTFVNAGTFQKTAGTGTTENDLQFENYGVVRATSGQLKIPNPVAVKSTTHLSHQSKCGDPVECASGNYAETQTDFEIGGLGVGLKLARTYSAQAAATASSPGAFGYGWTSSFSDRLTVEEAGKKITLTQAAGGVVPFNESGKGSYAAPVWSQDKLSGTAETGYMLTQPDQTIYSFSGSGRLESVTDRDGNETTISYDEAGRLKTITDPAGRQITLTYNGEGLVESAKDPMGHVVKYSYESKNLKTVTLPGEASPNWQFKYDTSHRMTSMTDGRGGKTTNEYDSSSRVISQTDPVGRTLTFKYEPFHTTIINKATGAITDEWFTSNNQPFSITRGFGTEAATTETFTYNAAGQLTGKTDGDGHSTVYGYDSEGNRTSERDAEGDETKWTYNEAHEATSETKPNGETTTIILDANGNPEIVSRPAPESETQTVSYGYGPHGEVESMTNPLGEVWSYEYDSHGDRIAEIDPEGDRRTWAYNEDSQVTSTVSPRGNEEGAEAAKFTTTIERDARGRPVKVINQLGGATKRAYDADGNLESVTDPNGHKTKFTYDADNERTKVEQPNGDVEETGYDGAGQVTSQTDGLKDKVTYVRNVLEQPIEIIDPLEGSTIRTFDAAGNLKTKTDPDGCTTTYGYDKANRLKEISYSAEPSQDVTFGYNEGGNLTSMIDGTGESTWEYDQLGRLVHSEDGYGETVSWAYDLGDEPVGLTYPNGKSISRVYDKVGRLEGVTDWLGHTTSFAYNRDSEPTATTFPAATTDSDGYAWDRADRMSSVVMKKGAETLASLAYSRDSAGQLESLIGKGLPGPEEEAFSYDENERLKSAGGGSYEYDAANNLTKAPGTTNAFDKASQIESATGATFTYDKDGERTRETPSSGPATIYKYDQAGSLTAIERPEEGETPSIDESFAYDGTGLLASRTAGLTTAHFVWDLSESPELLLSDGADSYVYGPNGLAVEQISSEEVPTYLHHDQLGSTRLLTNGSGEVSGSATFAPYGTVAGKNGSANSPFGFAGQYTMAQSGLIFLRARFYDPATAQFMTRDPIESITRSPYGYAKENPVGRIDPSGLCGVSSVGDFLESINPISEENCAYEAASSASEAVSKISLPSTREAAEAEVGFFDGGTVGLTKYARELFGIGNGGLALCGSTYEDSGIAGAAVFSVLAPESGEGALQIASRFPRISRWLIEHGDEATQIKDLAEEIIRHTVGK